MVYGIFTGIYSDWEVHGYFTNLDDAEKYCAEMRGRLDNPYIENIPSLQDKIDLSDVKIIYRYDVMFNIGDDHYTLLNDINYKCYKSTELLPDDVYEGWGTVIGFHISISKKNVDLAKKIAQDRLAELKEYSNSKRITKKAIDMLNYKLDEPRRIAEEKKKEEERLSSNCCISKHKK